MANINKGQNIRHANKHAPSQKPLIQPKLEQPNEVKKCNGIPVAKIVNYTEPKVNPPGAWKNKIAYDRDWNSRETNAEIERLFTGTGEAPAA